MSRGVRGIDHDRLAYGAFDGKLVHHRDEHILFPPTFPPVVMRPYFLGGSRYHSPLGLTMMIPLNAKRLSMRGLSWRWASRARTEPIDRGDGVSLPSLESGLSDGHSGNGYSREMDR